MALFRKQQRYLSKLAVVPMSMSLVKSNLKHNPFVVVVLRDWLCGVNENKLELQSESPTQHISLH